jgi:hypothetical protein
MLSAKSCVGTTTVSAASNGVERSDAAEIINAILAKRTAKR